MKAKIINVPQPPLMSLEIINKFVREDPRIRLIKNSRNIGQSASFNIGILESRGEFVCFFDGDDICYPEKISTQISFLIQNPLYVMIGCAVRTFCSLNNSPGIVWNYETNEELMRIKSLFKSEVISSSMMMRRKILIDNEINLNVDLKLGADWDLSLQLMRIGKVGNLPSVLFDYRIHSEQTTNSLMDDINSDSTRIRLVLLNELGIKPTDMELKIHLAISPCNYWPLGEHPYFKQLSDSLLIKSSQWFDKLIQQNQQYKRYNPEKFREYLEGLRKKIEVALSEMTNYKTCPALGKLKCQTQTPCKKLS